MIEVELKLEVDDFSKFDGLVPKREKRVLDHYFDTEDYRLIRTGNFLRNRNNKNVEFKLNMDDLSHTFCRETSFDYQNFLPNKALIEIFKGFGLELNENFANFEEFLEANKLKTLAVIDKHRKEYEYQNLVISLDDAKDIGKFIEIECDLEDGTKFDKDEITSNMITTLQNIGLLDKYRKVKIGYVELYLKKHNKVAYDLGLYKE